MKINNVKIDDKCSLEANLNLPPEDLAEIFWHMDEKQQADFFCHLGDKPKKDFEMQMIAVCKKHLLTENAWHCMRVIGECAAEEA